MEVEIDLFYCNGCRGMQDLNLGRSHAGTLRRFDYQTGELVELPIQLCQKCFVKANKGQMLYPDEFK